MTNPVNPAPQSSIPTSAAVAPTSAEVTKFHTNSDVDSSVTAQHHTLGISHNQASPGDHIHNGKSSKVIGKGVNLAFPLTANATYNQAQIQAIIDALRRLGWGS